MKNVKEEIRKKLESMVELKSIEAFKTFIVLNRISDIDYGSKSTPAQRKPFILDKLSHLFNLASKISDDKDYENDLKTIENQFYKLINVLMSRMDIENKQEDSIEEGSLYVAYKIIDNHNPKSHSKKVECILGINIRNQEYIEISS